MTQPALNVASQLNAARHHMSQGRLDDADKILTHLKAVVAPHPVLFEYLGFIAVQRKDLKKAVRCYRKAVKLDPGCAQLKMKLAEMSLAVGDQTEAKRLAQIVHRKDSKNVAVLNLLGLLAGQEGQRTKAQDFFRAAIQVDPDNVHAWQRFGALCFELGEWKEAVDALLSANTLCPNHRPTLTMIGRSYTALGKPDLAIGHLHTAQSLASSNEDYNETTAYLIEAYLRTQQLDAALAAVHHLEERDPSFERGHALHAMILHEQGHFEKALTKIRSIIERQDVIDADWFPHYLEPQCLLCLEEHKSAAAAFDTANRRQSKTFERMGTDKNTYIRFAEEAIKHFAQAEEISPGTPNERGAGQGLAFINGFPRSGTTLIDAILRTHSQIAIAEESPAAHSCLQEAGRVLPQNGRDFAAINDDVARHLRQFYFERLDDDLSAARHERTVIDRHATGLLQAGFMKLLFPCAQFFFMLRHPCDVVLSAWFANFHPTDHTANYLTIEDTARFYDLMMTLYTTLEDNRGLDATIIRYEDLVTDLRGTVDPVLDAMGLAWEEPMEAFHRSQHRPKRTVSFNQISKPLYTAAAHRFEHYRAPLEPVMPLLRPWIERFGYDQPAPSFSEAPGSAFAGPVG
ncbi:MAG: sulfotransferase [Pseudomonadota bacterium]